MKTPLFLYPGRPSLFFLVPLEKLPYYIWVSHLCWLFFCIALPCLALSYPSYRLCDSYCFVHPSNHTYMHAPVPPQRRPAWPADDRREKFLLGLLLTLVRIEDDHRMARIRFLYEDQQYGLMAVIKSQLNEVGMPTYCFEGAGCGGCFVCLGARAASVL